MSPRRVYVVHPDGRARSGGGAINKGEKEWELVLYVAGQSIQSKNAVIMVKALCNVRLMDRCHLEVVDLREHPDQAFNDQIIAIPTLVRRRPGPEKRLIGISSLEKISAGLEVEKFTVA
jgi:circadian clock protein KaiB